MVPNEAYKQDTDDRTTQLLATVSFWSYCVCNKICTNLGFSILSDSYRSDQSRHVFPWFQPCILQVGPQGLDSSKYVSYKPGVITIAEE